ncbi:MAG: TGS domain-containing protein [Candidatus Heimdallarchaeota archaeon]|nr:TGS domain-containing protein [Candidatus Heimdallarchaeota archaeon]
MSSRNKLRWFLYDTANRLRLLEGAEFAAEVDSIIDEIHRKKLDKFGDFKQLIMSLECRKVEALATPKTKSKQYDPFEIPESGIGRFTLFGLSNIGKSTLMNAITNTDVQTGNFLHTTTIGQAGSCSVEGVNFQIIDLPGFLDFKNEWVLNKQILRVARTSDAILLVIDLTMDIDRQLSFLKEKLEEAKLLLNGESSHKIAIIATKGDLPGSKEAYIQLAQKTNWPIYPISIKNLKSLEKLKGSLFELLDIIRVYTKPPGKKPNLTEPFIIPSGATVKDVAEKIHTSFIKRFRFARVWGKSCEFAGQQVGLDHELCDKDILELVISR